MESMTKQLWPNHGIIPRCESALFALAPRLKLIPVIGPELLAPYYTKWVWSSGAGWDSLQPVEIPIGADSDTVVFSQQSLKRGSVPDWRRSFFLCSQWWLAGSLPFPTAPVQKVAHS